MKCGFTFRSIFVAFLLFTTFSFAQSVSGTLIDKETGETIPFATVQLGEHYGVVTNQEGDFSINISNFSKTDSLVFSSMGYHRKAIALKNFKNDTVFLNKNIEELAAVLLLEKKLTALQVMERVKANLVKNYEHSLRHFTVFYRYHNSNTPKRMKITFKNKRDDFLDKKSIHKINHSLDSLNNALSGKKSNYYSAELVELFTGKKDTAKTQIVKATELVNEEESTSMENLKENVFATLLQNLKTSNTFQVRTGIIPIIDSLKMDDIIMDEEEIDSAFARSTSYRNNLTDFGFQDDERLNFVTQLDDYTYKIKDITTFNNEVVYVVSFSPDEGLFSGNGKMAGTMYISAGSFAVLKAEYHYAEGKDGRSLNLKFLAGIAFEQKEKSGKIIFQKTEHGKYIPKYIKKQNKNYVFFDRNFVFKENDERANRMKIKFEVNFELEQTGTQEWLVVKSRKISEQKFAEIKQKTAIPVEKTAEYNPEIWKDYNILAPTEAIREYEK